MPPLFGIGTRSSPYENTESSSNNSIVIKRSSNAVNREFEISRADAVSRAAGATGLGGRAFVCVSAGKGNSVSTYM